MPLNLSSRFLRSQLLLVLGALVILLMPVNAYALSLMDPFNIPQAMDAGVKKVGDNIAYADGPRKKLDVYAPSDLKGLAPVVFFIYGGGWDHGDKADYQFVGHALAARGFVVVIADYRLYPEVSYPDFLDDNAQALRWVQDNIKTYGGDTGRLFLSGHSAGAYNAVMLGLDSSFMRDYGVTMQIKGIAALSGPYDFYPFEYNEVRNSFGNAPSPEGTQPVNLVTSDAPPMFLASGTTDPIVRVQNTENLSKKLRDQGVWVTDKYYEGFGHMEVVIAMGAMWRWRMPVLNDVVTFFERFGAFPSGVPHMNVIPDQPEQKGQPINEVVAGLDDLFQPIDKADR
ncbi:MAG TPA: alpha/beta hydrolase [Arsenicitalea sp.]|nr:alpha/beta hydrolase [Arsenicitalea sp.]